MSSTQKGFSAKEHAGAPCVSTFSQTTFSSSNVLTSVLCQSATLTEVHTSPGVPRTLPRSGHTAPWLRAGPSASSHLKIWEAQDPRARVSYDICTFKKSQPNIQGSCPQAASDPSSPPARPSTEIVLMPALHRSAGHLSVLRWQREVLVCRH